MNPIKKALELNKIPYYSTHLSIINCLLPVKMTEMEIKVLAAFLSLEGDITSDRFGTSARKIVMEQLKITPPGLSNYITSLLRKGFIKKVDDGDTIILPILFAESKEQTYLLKLVKVEEDAEVGE